MATTLPSTPPLSTSWPTVLDAVLVAAPTAALTAIFSCQSGSHGHSKGQAGDAAINSPSRDRTKHIPSGLAGQKGDASVYRRADNGADNHPADDLSFPRTVLPRFVPSGR